ncbi:MAG: hypothetical protein ABL878_20275 [Burkholderiales bacterium]
MNAPWILFEAGALSKTKSSHVCTFLLDVAPADIEPPLGQFQHTVFAKDDVRQLVESINKATYSSAERALPEQTLSSVFEKFWPDLETALKKIAALKEEKPVQRPERELLEEVLEILRSQEQRKAKEMDEMRRRNAIRQAEVLAAQEQGRPSGTSSFRDLLIGGVSLKDYLETAGVLTGPTGPANSPETPIGPTGPTGPTGPR